MTRLALLLVLPLLACGDGASVTDSGASFTSGATTPGPTTDTSTGVSPTTGATGSTSTSSASDSDGTGTSTGGSSEGSAGTSTGTSTDASTSTTDTTAGVDASTSSSSGDDSSTSSGESSTTSTSTGSTTDETGGALVMPAGICSGNVTSFVEPMLQAKELHIVSVYQGTGGAITVSVNRTGIPLTLVLSSYESVNFTLVLAPGVLLDKVILNGYDPHTVQGQGVAPVTDLSGQFNYLAACAYIWPGDNGGCDTPGLVTGAENLTGLTLASFIACYEGSSFTLD